MLPLSSSVVLQHNTSILIFSISLQSCSTINSSRHHHPLADGGIYGNLGLKKKKANQATVQSYLTTSCHTSESFPLHAALTGTKLAVKLNCLVQIMFLIMHSSCTAKCEAGFFFKLLLISSQHYLWYLYYKFFTYQLNTIIISLTYSLGTETEKN